MVGAGLEIFVAGFLVEATFCFDLTIYLLCVVIIIIVCFNFVSSYVLLSMYSCLCWLSVYLSFAPGVYH